MMLALQTLIKEWRDIAHAAAELMIADETPNTDENRRHAIQCAIFRSGGLPATFAEIDVLVKQSLAKKGR